MLEKGGVGVSAAPNHGHRKQHGGLKTISEGSLVLVLLLIVGALVNSHILFSPEGLYPGPVDQLGHLMRVWYLGEVLRSDGQVPAWCPYWYCGVATYQYYPPLSFVFMTLVYLLAPSVVTVYRVVVLLFPALGGLGAYYCGKRIGGSAIGVLTALLFAFHPYNLRTLTLMGNFAQAAVWVISPFALLAALRLFDGEKLPGSWVLSCTMWAFMILGHAMCAAVSALGIGVVVLGLAINHRRLVPVVAWISSVVIGLGLSGFWVLPGVTPIENPEIPFLLPERAFAQSVSWYIFDPTHRCVSTHAQYFGLSLTVLALLGAFLLIRDGRSESRAKGIILSSSLVLCVVVAFGNNTPLWRVMPLATQIVPDRILNYGSLVQSMLSSLAVVRLIGALVRRLTERVAWALRPIVVLCVLFAIYLDFKPYLRMGGMVDYSVLSRVVSQIPRSSRNAFEQGRLAIVTYEWVSAANFFPPVEGIGLIDGWNQEGTPHQEVMVEQNLTAHYGFWDYHVRNYALRNVRSVIAREAQESKLIQALEAQGFKEAHQEHGVSLYLNEVPSSYAFDMTDSMLVVGKGSLWATTVLPWAARGREDALLSYAPEYLESFPAIFIDEPGADEREKLEARLISLALDGKTVVVDLSNSGFSSLLGVTKHDIQATGEVELIGAPGSPFPQSIVEDVTRADGQPLRGASYKGLDVVLLSVRIHGIDYPIVGYRELQNGRIYFVGFGSTRSVIDTGNRDLAVLFRPLFDQVKVRKDMVPPFFPVDSFEWDHSGVAFRYSMDRPKPVMLSITYSPRWTLRIDGNVAPIYDHENFILFNAPAGSHSVSIKYGITWVGIAGIVATAVSILVMAVVALTWRRWFNKMEKWTISSFRLRPASSPPTRQYRV